MLPLRQSQPASYSALMSCFGKGFQLPLKKDCCLFLYLFLHYLSSSKRQPYGRYFVITQGFQL